jgi:hypothetical protein
MNLSRIIVNPQKCEATGKAFTRLIFVIGWGHSFEMALRTKDSKLMADSQRQGASDRSDHVLWIVRSGHHHIG